MVGFGRGWGRGSGIVVAPGRVITNAHNVGDADVMVSFPDGRRERGTVAGRDLDFDLAAVRVDTGKLDPVAWRPAATRAAAGDPVIALANPGGAGVKAMLGFVSAVDRDIRGPRDRLITGCIEHDVRVPPGLGGVPLVDVEGRLLGLNCVRLEDGQIAAVRAGEELAERLEQLWAGGGDPDGGRSNSAPAGVALAQELPHPMFGQIEVLAEEPPFDRALMERLGTTRLHVGCGPYMLRRWLNTDLRAFADEDGRAPPADRIVCARSERHRERYYLRHDARHPYPFQDGSFDVVYSEHFIEHVPRGAAVTWLRDVRRLLRPGGFLRLSTPDLRRYVEGYGDPEGAFFAEHHATLRELPQFARSGVPDTRGFMVNQIFRFFGHQWIYDLEEFRAVAAEAGFDPGAVTECSFQQGRAADVAKTDQASHSDESLYVEVVRT